MDLGIKDRLALVTGASRGIGRAIALELAREGARLVLVARNADALDAVRRQTSAPDKHHAVTADLMTDTGLKKLAEAIGTIGSLSIMVHNLGGSAGVIQAMASSEDWKKVWHFNVGIAHELNRMFIPAMVERRWGRIVHLSTLSTRTYTGYAAYVSAKCALDGYVKTVSREVSQHNVILAAVAPGAVLIEGRYFAKLQQENPSGIDDYFKNHLAIRRLGKPEDVAAAVVFLCSDQASYMAGAVVAVDGGWV